MTRRPASGAALLASAIAAIVLASGCGGGPSGTAHSTVQGNVAAVEQAMRGGTGGSSLLARILELVRPIAPAWAQTGLDGIRVSIEGTPWETETDERGDFVLESPFAGAGTLLFVRENDQLVGRIGVDVPDGGTVTLRNVRCGRTSGGCRADAIETETPSPSEPSPPSDVSAPSEPSLPDPSEPDVSMPAEPSPFEPSEPGVSVPAEPSLPDPSEPSVSVPAEPSPFEPSEPGVSVPSEPSVSEPSV